MILNVDVYKDKSSNPTEMEVNKREGTFQELMKVYAPLALTMDEHYLSLNHLELRLEQEVSNYMNRLQVFKSMWQGRAE